MRKLLRAGVRRYTHSILFWLGIVLSIVIGLYSGREAQRTLYFQDGYYQWLLLSYSSIISLLIGREFSDGIFRNKITCGHSKGSIFLSEAILAIGSVLFMFILCSACYIPFKLSILNIVSVKLVLQVYLALVLVTISFASIAVLVSCCISRKAVASIVNILLVVALVAVGSGVCQWLGQPEYNTYLYGGDMIMDENGNTSYKVKNNDYVEKPLRYVLIATEAVTPYSLLYYDRLIIWDMYCESYREQKEYASTGNYKNPVYQPEAKKYNKINTLSICQTGVIIVLIGVGYLVFRKKDFK